MVYENLVGKAQPKRVLYDYRLPMSTVVFPPLGFLVSARWGWGILLEFFGDELVGGIEGVVDFVGIFAAGLGELRPTAASATYHRSDVLNDIAGLEAAVDQVVGNGGKERNLIVVGSNS
jgi:hypothetical protein